MIFFSARADRERKHSWWRLIHWTRRAFVQTICFSYRRSCSTASSSCGSTGLSIIVGCGAASATSVITIVEGIPSYPPPPYPSIVVMLWGLPLHSTNRRTLEDSWILRLILSGCIAICMTKVENGRVGDRGSRGGTIVTSKPDCTSSPTIMTSHGRQLVIYYRME